MFSSSVLLLRRCHDAWRSRLMSPLRGHARCWQRMLFCFLLAGAGPATVSAATLDAAPSTAAPGAMFVANVDGLTTGNTYRIYLERGSPFVQRFLLSDFTAPDNETTRKLVVPDDAQITSHHLVLYAIAGAISGEVGRTPFTVGTPLSLSFLPTSAEPGRAVTVTVNGTRAGSISINYAGRVLLGPVAVGDGSYVGKFIVPRDIPATIPGPATVVASNLVGKSVVGRGSRTFSVLAPSGLPVFRSAFTAPPPPTVKEGTRLSFAGRVQQPDGTGTTGRTSFFWKGDDGTVVPIDGGVTTAADGTYDVKARAPSLYMDGLRTRGSGKIMGTVQDTDPNTGKRRDSVFDTGNRAEAQFPDQFQPGEGQFVLRLRGRNAVGQLVVIEGAYVEVVGGFDAAFSDPNDDIPPQGVDDLMYTQNQFSPVQNTFVGNTFLGANSCPITFARKRTNAIGEAAFEFDAEALLSLLLLQETSEMGEIRTEGDGAPVPGVDVFEQVGGPGFKGGNTGTTVGLVLGIYAGHKGHGETNLLDSGGNQVPPPAPDPVLYQPTYISLLIDVDSGLVSVSSGGQFGTVSTPVDGPLTDGILTVDIPYLNPFSNDIAIEKLDIAGLPNPTNQFGAKRFAGMHSFPDHAKWPGPDSPANLNPLGRNVFSQRNVGREMRFEWEIGFGPIEAKLLLKHPNPNVFTDYGTFALAGDSGCNLSGVVDYTIALPDLTRLPVSSGAIAHCIVGQIQYKRSGSIFTPAQNFKICTRAPPSDMHVGNTQIDLSTFSINGATSNYTGNMIMPMSDVDDGGDSRMREYHVPPQENASNNDGSFHKGVDAAGAGVETYNTAAQPLIGSEGTLPTLNELTSFGFKNDTQEIGNEERLIILDTGNIPLFRYPWGFSPIAGAVLGADFWLGASIGFYGTAGNPTGDGTMLDATIDPSMEGGVDMFFDLDVLFGLISASVSALPSLDLTLRETIGKGGYFPKRDDTNADGVCYGFDLDVEMEICAVFCASDEFNVFRVQEGDGCTAAQAKNKGGFDQGRAGFDLGKPKLLPNAVAVDGQGHELVVQLDGQNRLVATHMEGTNTVAERVIEPVANGIQHVDVIYTAGSRAVAVWSESSLTPRAIATLIGTPPEKEDHRARDVTDDLARAQILRYSYFNGTAWSTPATVPVAQPGSVGKPRLAVCRFSFLVGSGCSSRAGAAYLVWEYDANKNIAAPDMEIWGAGYTPGGSFGVATRISNATGSSDMQADVTYMGGTPAVAWISNSGAPYGDPTTRQIAYRIIDRLDRPTFPVQLLRNTNGAGWPSLAAVDNDELVLAFTRAQDASIVGNRNALTVAKGTCIDDRCNFAITQPRDPYGRQIRGERPVVALENGEAMISFRGLAYGPDANGETARPSDTKGMMLGTGEHLAMRVTDFSAATVEVAVQNLSSNGLQHWRPEMVFDASLDAFVGISQEVANPAIKYRAEEFAKRYAGKEIQPVSHSKAIGTTGLMMKTLAPTPDFRIEAFSLAAPYLTAGTSANYTLTLRNAGAAYDPSVHGTALVLVAWDAPPGAGVNAASPFALNGPMAANAEITLIRPAGVPSTHQRDERRTLFAEVRNAAATPDANADDNVADATVGDMPVPHGLFARIKTNSPVIGLDWTAANDPRVVGYRVYKLAENGKFVPYGSSQVAGYADLFAGFRNIEQYRVTSYSDRGIESELSGVVIAAPEQTTDMFTDGFEETP